MADLFSQLNAYSESDFYPYHMPGHKRRGIGELPCELAALDITEIDGFDNLHQPEGIIREMEQQAAWLYGAEESFLLVNGSTCGILSAISSAVPKGGHILLARNCHKAAYHAVYMRDLKVTYLYPELHPEFPIYQGIRAEQVAMALEREPDIQAVFIVSPTYEGRISEVEAIARVVHAYGIPLIVDEAHGAHLGFHQEFASNSNRCGADLVIHSVHKTLPSMTQTAILHVNGSLVDRELLKRFLRIYQSSSPSYVLMGSIGNVLNLLEQDGKTLFEGFARAYRQLLETLGRCKVLRFLPPEATQDIGKLVVFCPDSYRDKEGDFRQGISGQALYHILRERFRLQPEMAAGNYCLAMFTVADRQEGYTRMQAALLQIDEELYEGTLQHDGATVPVSAELMRKIQCTDAVAVKSLQEAWDAPGQWVPIEEAEGRLAGDFINLYPPGVPIVVPGERITKEMCALVQSYQTHQMTVQGIRILDNVTYVSVL